MRWLCPKYLYPRWDDDGNRLTEEDVDRMLEEYDKMKSARLVRLWGECKLGSDIATIIENVLLHRGLNTDGTPLSSIDKSTLRDFEYQI